MQMLFDDAGGSQLVYIGWFCTESLKEIAQQVLINAYAELEPKLGTWTLIELCLVKTLRILLVIPIYLCIRSTYI